MIVCDQELRTILGRTKRKILHLIPCRCLCEDDVPLSQTNKSQCGLDPLLLQAKRDGISSYDLITGESAVIKDGLSGG